MATYYRCLYCAPPKWQPASKCAIHMRIHAENGDDIGAPKVPATYEELVRRWSSAGMLEEKEG